ncbi:type II secretion system F family protein [Massilia sp. Se16.2.3]|uniref:type II secretion system F family protein n=1 Tax=Massilia sp. Se16.2.3 TaxID=2709303 RepID=UPI001E573F7B|nr:type II secretion system F family protein [Massilia sp. Se16.2.3]
MQFAVRTLAPDLSISSLVVDALDETDARRQIEAQGLFVSDIAPAGGAVARTRGPKLSLVLFSRELLALLNAGLGIVEGPGSAAGEGSQSRRARRARAPARRPARRQAFFSSVLASQPQLFPPLYVGIVRAAEGTSDLPRALSRYIDYQQRIDTVRAKIVSASIYPVILLCVGGGVSTFLIGYVVPRFAEVYQGAGRNLPWMSQLLLEWGQFAASHGTAVLLTLGTAVAAAVLGVRRMLRSGGITRLLARLPGIGERARIYELSRLYLTLGMLLEAGITIVGAIETVGPMVSGSLRAALTNARLAIESGRPLSDAFEAHGLTTPISLRMLRVGERTGDMGPMLTQSAAFYDGEISRWIDRFTRTFEPLLMAAIGLVVGAIVVLLYMPIFDLAVDMS